MRYNFFPFLLMSMVLSAQPSIKFELAYQGYNTPVDISDPEDGTDRLFIVEKDGRIKIIENGNQLAANFLDIVAKVNSGGERGLLGLVFHPDYENNGFFYINYVDNSNKTTIARFKVSADKNIADPNTEKVLFQVHQPRTNHNAGDLNFSPIDNYLYIALGDGGSGGDPDCYSQDSSSMLGKIMRINVTTDDVLPYYTIPIDNPYIGVDAVTDEIWAFGLRNPWRVSFDRETGDYWLADVGQGIHEEVNYLPSGTAGGLNFGWNFREGSICYDGDFTNCTTVDTLDCESIGVYTDPIIEFDRTNANGARSITGGYVYRGCKYPDMVGRYICTDYVTDNSWYMDSDGIAVKFDGGGVESVTTYGEDHNGELYLASLSGSIYRVVDDNVIKTLTITSADYPLSGTYKSTDRIVVADLLNQNLTGVKFISEMVEFNEDVTIPLASDLIISNNFCDN